MNSYLLSHLSDGALLRALSSLVAQDRSTTSTLLAHIAEVDARKLYLPAGYSSMFAYCVEELRLSEDSASRRIRVARLAREYPRVLTAISEGRLHLSAVLQLGPYLTPGRADDLLDEASGKSKLEIDLILARRFPRTESIALVEAVPVPTANFLPAPAPVENWPALATPEKASRAPAPVAEIAPRRFDVRMTIADTTQEKLRYAQDLLGHSVRSGDLATVFDRALDALIARLERQKFAATDRPRRTNESTDPRRIPAHVKRAVWQRDNGRCTYVGENGHTCNERAQLEYDHVTPVARGGRATVENLRLRCRAHNQYEADRAFGREFMDAQRQRAKERAEEVIPWLRQLGLKVDEAQRAAELCEDMPGATLEERVKRALTGWLPRGTVRIPAPA